MTTQQKRHVANELYRTLQDRGLPTDSRHLVPLAKFCYPVDPDNDADVRQAIDLVIRAYNWTG